MKTSTPRVALITGCGKAIGIGAAIARAFAGAGITVVATDVASAGVQNDNALTNANNTFTGLLTFNQINSGSWADVSVTTDAPLTLGPLQSGGSVNLQTQGALTTNTISTSGSLTVNSHGGAVSVAHHLSRPTWS